MIKRALTVGINAYPNAPLNGCVNDANGWAELLQDNGYRVFTLADKAATKLAILANLRDLVSQSRYGDRIVFTYSGHGSWVPDVNGDEDDGRDEVLCPIDYASGGFITDDELADVFAARRRGVRVVIFSDSCHSGSVSRFAGLPVVESRRIPPDAMRVVEGRTRFVHPATFLGGDEATQARIFRADRAASTTTPRTSAGTVLFSGCADEELSWDAYIDGRPQGAFTATALQAHRLLASPGRPAVRLGAWHRMIRTGLPSEEYPQTPELYASLWQRSWTL